MESFLFARRILNFLNLGVQKLQYKPLVKIQKTQNDLISISSKRQGIVGKRNHTVRPSMRTNTFVALREINCTNSVKTSIFQVL